MRVCPSALQRIRLIPLARRVFREPAQRPKADNAWRHKHALSRSRWIDSCLAVPKLFSCRPTMKSNERDGEGPDKAECRADSGETLAKVRAELEDFRSYARAQLEAEAKKNAAMNVKLSKMRMEIHELSRQQADYVNTIERLNRELHAMRMENEQLVGQNANDKKAKIEELLAEKRKLKERCEQADITNRELEEGLQELGQILRDQVRKTEENAEIIKTSLEQRLAASEVKLRDLTARRLKETHQQELNEIESRSTIARLTEEKEELVLQLESKEFALREMIEENKRLKADHYDS